MNLDPLHVSQLKLDANYLLYKYLKTFNSALSKTTLSNFQTILGQYSDKVDVYVLRNMLQESVQNIAPRDNKQADVQEILLNLQQPQDIHILRFTLKIIQIRPYLLEKAKLVDVSAQFDQHKEHPLSLKADGRGKREAFYMRVNGALLALALFQEIEDGNAKIVQGISNDFQKQLVQDYKKVQALGVEVNQMFMLMFSESMSQSIRSRAGSSFEDGIKRLLQSQGIDNIKEKTHDELDASTEYDFLFTLNGRHYGLGAKRTLRERYKQFIKTAASSSIDVMIEVTLGLDLRKNIAQNIRNYGVYLFVADEVYDSYEYLQDISGIFPGSQLTKSTLETLA